MGPSLAFTDLLCPEPQYVTSNLQTLDYSISHKSIPMYYNEANISSYFSLRISEDTIKFHAQTETLLM